jgi:hypothetical protein
MAAVDAVQQRLEYAIRIVLTQREASHDSHAAIAIAAIVNAILPRDCRHNR